MRSGRLNRRAGLAAAGLVVLLALGLALRGGDDPPPASPAALSAVAAKNADAAVAAAARMKAESKAATRAADARVRRSEAEQ